MLHKDEYNQDEYNDYYARETRGAEISNQKDSGGNKKILIIITLLALILVGSYFGWKSIKGSQNNDSNITKDIKDKEPIDNKKDIREDAIRKEVKNAIDETNSNSKMSPEDIANIVQIVMKKINQQSNNETKSEEKTLPKTQEQIKDNKLMKSLENSEVDSLVSQLENINISEKDNNKKAESKDKVDTYNKKVVPSEKMANDELSRISNDISNLVEDNREMREDKNSTRYIKEVDKETKERKKEMRYITVRKGDTLGKIAKRVYGNVMMYKKIYEANPDILRRADKIYIGQRLRVPE